MKKPKMILFDYGQTLVNEKLFDGVMAISYKRLWKLLVDKEMSKSDLRKKSRNCP